MMNVNYKIYENEIEEFERVAEDIDAFDVLLTKLSNNQRIFLNKLKEIVDSDIDSEEWLYEQLVFAKFIEMYSSAPELVPDAPMATLKKSVRNKTYKNEFQQMVDIMTRWIESLRKKMDAMNKIVSTFFKLPKLVIYGAFVAVLVFALISVVHLFQILGSGLSFMLVKQILLIIAAGFVTIVLGKAVIIKAYYKNVNLFN